MQSYWWHRNIKSSGAESLEELRPPAVTSADMFKSSPTKRPNGVNGAGLKVPPPGGINRRNQK